MPHRHLAHLETAGLIRVAQLEPELEYLFQHALIQDAAYDSLLRQDRRALHRRVGEVLEQAHAGRVEEIAPLLAHHFHQAGDDDRALHYFTYSASHALTLGAVHEAENYYCAALDLVQEARDRAILLTGLGEARYHAHKTEEAIEVWREAIGLWTTLGDMDRVSRLYARSARTAWWASDRTRALNLCHEGLRATAGGRETAGLGALLSELARALFFTGQSDQALEPCQRALAIAERTGDVEVEIDTLTTLGLLYYKQNRTQEAVEATQQAVELARQEHLQAAATRAHHNLASMLSMSVGDLRTGRLHAQHAADLTRRAASPGEALFSQGYVLLLDLLMGEIDGAEATLSIIEDMLTNVAPSSPGAVNCRVYAALLPRFRGDLPEARRTLAAIRAEALETENDFALEAGDNWLADVLIELGEWDEARIVLDEMHGFPLVDTHERVWNKMMLSRMALRSGDAPTAHRYYEEGQEAAGEQSDLWSRVFMQEGEIRLTEASGDLDEAIRLNTRHAELLTQCELRWYLARALVRRAELHLKRAASGDTDCARSLLTQARDLFAAMPAPGYVDRVEARLAEIAAS
jgi:tetratricopeptide (TPR) repeat protein